SIPDAVRKRELLHAGCAPRTFARLIPRLDPVRRRDRTSRLEIHPLHARGSWEGEAIQSSLKTRRGGRRGLLREQLVARQARGGGCFWKPWHFRAHDRVIKFLAIEAYDSLSLNGKSGISVARNASAIATPRTFKQICASHVRLHSAQKLK